MMNRVEKLCALYARHLGRIQGTIEAREEFGTDKAAAFDKISRIVKEMQEEEAALEEAI